MLPPVHGNSLNEAAVQIKHSCIARDLSLDHTAPWGRGLGGNKVHYALETATAAGTSPKRSSLQGRCQKGRKKKRKGRGNWGEKEREQLLSSSAVLFSVYATQARVPKK